MASLSGDDSDNASEETVVTRTRTRSGRSAAKSPRRGRKKGPQSRPTRSSGRKLATQVEVDDEEQIEEIVTIPMDQMTGEGMRSSDQSDVYERMEVEQEYIVEEDLAYEDANSGEATHEENGLGDENGEIEQETVEESNAVEEVDSFGQLEEEMESGDEKVEYEVEQEDEEEEDEEKEEESERREEEMEEEARLEEEYEPEAIAEEIAEESLEREDEVIQREDDVPREEEVREEEDDERGEVVVREDTDEAVMSEDSAQMQHVAMGDKEDSPQESVVQEEENSRKATEEEEEARETVEQQSPKLSTILDFYPELERPVMSEDMMIGDSDSFDNSKEQTKDEQLSAPVENVSAPVAEEVYEEGQKKRKRKTRFSFDAEGEVSLDSVSAPKRVARGDGEPIVAEDTESKKSSLPEKSDVSNVEEENSVEVKGDLVEGIDGGSDADSLKKKLKSKNKGAGSTSLKDETRPVAVKRLAAVASGVGATAAALLAEAAAAAKATASSEGDMKKKSGSKSQKRKIVLADGDTYDPSSPTSENSCDETPAKRASREKQEKAKRQQASGGATTTTPSTPTTPTTTTSGGGTPEKAKKTLPELEKYWKAVKEDPSDFTGWTYLLQYVDQENDVEAAREAYDSFLAYYPYCYGYWRKYADYERKKGNKLRCQEVFERGLKAIPLSVDLWIHYLNFCKTSAYVDDEDAIRQQFENGVAACGIEFRSDRLWENYIKWETEGKRLQNVTAIYDRVLHIPTQNYSNHFENFMQHIMNHPPQKVLSVDEFLTLRREVLQQLKQNESSVTPSEVHPPAPGADDDDAPPGMEDAPPGDDDEVPAVVPKQSITRSDEETTALREKVIAIRREIHKSTSAMVATRWNYEEGIKRPYFHVKPLERCQLKNWKEYLDFEIEQGEQERIITLFERCLIPCALYEEFWIRFVRYLEGMGDEMVEKVRDVYHRACTIHHTKKPTLHLYWAAFEESQENYEKAAEILMNLEKIMPNLLQVAYRLINLERRRGNLDKVCSLYEHYITTSKNKTVATNMAIKYARFCWKVIGDVDKAVKILRDELEKEKENPRLYLQLIDMGLQKNPFDEKEVIAIFDEFLSKEGIETEQKVLFAQRKVEFLEDFGMDIMSVQKAYDEYQRYTKMAKDRKKKSADGDKGDGHSKKKGMASESSQQAQQQGSQSAQSPGQSSAYQQQSGQAVGTYKTADYSASGTTTVSASAASGQYTQPPYPGGGYPPPQQGPPPPYGGQAASYPAGQYNQSTDPNYAGYQNWGYPQTGYGYNQGWGGYNYY